MHQMNMNPIHDDRQQQRQGFWSFVHGFAVIGCVLLTWGTNLVAANESSQAKTASSQPNILMIVSDDQAWTDYSFMGHPTIETPRLDQLAKESLTFQRGYVPNSLCRPSLMSMITGLYPYEHGVVGNDPPRPVDPKNPKRRMGSRDPRYVPNRKQFLMHVDAAQTLPEILAKDGYRSLQTGKWWEGSFGRGGFTDGMTHGDRDRDGRHGDLGLSIGRKGYAAIDKFLDDVTTPGEESPFFLWYAPFLPHTPHTPPADLLKKYQARVDSPSIAKYYAMVEWFDQSCGEVLDRLEKHGVADNTIVLYVTDNGWINDPKASRYAPRSKRSPNEGGIRTPIMIRWPGQVTPRMDESNLASSIDLVPTVLKMLGKTVPDRLTGTDLLDSDAVVKRNRVYGDIYEHDIVAMDDPSQSLRYRWVIDGNVKLIQPSSRMHGESAQLFDLAKDPHENRDLAASRPEETARLQKLLNEWWTP